MMKFLKSKTGIIVIIAIVVLALGAGAVWFFTRPDDSKRETGKEPEREFEILEDGEEESISDDALNVAEPDEEADAIVQGGAQFPAEIPGEDTPSTETPGEDTPSTETPGEDTPSNETPDPLDGGVPY